MIVSRVVPLQAARLLQFIKEVSCRLNCFIESKIQRSMIKRSNENHYNLQLRFLVSLRDLEGDRKCYEFLLCFLFIFLPETEDIVTMYADKSC